MRGILVGVSLGLTREVARDDAALLRVATAAPFEVAVAFRFARR